MAYTAAAKFATGGVIGTNFSERTAGTTTDGEGALFTLGDREIGTNGTTWLYVQAATAIGATDYVTYDENFQASAGNKTALDAGHGVGVAGGTAFADNDFGWIAISGNGLTVNVSSACAADVPLYTTLTAGQLDDSSSVSTVAQTRVLGIVAVSAAASTAVTAVGCIMTWPKSNTI